MGLRDMFEKIIIGGMSGVMSDLQVIRDAEETLKRSQEELQKIIKNDYRIPEVDDYNDEN